MVYLYNDSFNKYYQETETEPPTLTNYVKISHDTGPQLLKMRLDRRGENGSNLSKKLDCVLGHEELLSVTHK